MFDPLYTILLTIIGTVAIVLNMGIWNQSLIFWAIISGIISGYIIFMGKKGGKAKYIAIIISILVSISLSYPIIGMLAVLGYSS